jgi:hypothetical protein
MAQLWSEIVTELETAKTAILGGSQSYSISGRALTRADLGTIMSELRHAKLMANREDNAGISIRQVTPVDA